MTCMQNMQNKFLAIVPFTHSFNWHGTPFRYALVFFGIGAGGFVAGILMGEPR